MIHESNYWKSDLLKLANTLERRLTQTRWNDKNLFTIEKEIFFGFYAIRKLIESKKISDSITQCKHKMKEFPYSGNSESLLTYMKDNEYDLASGETAYLTTIELCNQFIHSYHFLPFLPDEKHLIGFFFCSDRKRTSGIYMITVFDVVNIYRSVGSNYPTIMRRERLPNGKSIISIE
ncbi:hypothetical protein [Achromobacter aloeverae]